LSDLEHLRRWQLRPEMRDNIRKAICEAFGEIIRTGGEGLKRISVGHLGKEAAARALNTDNPADEQAKWILEVLSDMERAGLIFFGDRFDRVGHAWVWPTKAGLDWLDDWRTSPENRPGYLEDVTSIPNVSDIARSYLQEAQELFLAGYPRAAAVMVGAVSEVTVYEIRKALVDRLTAIHGKPPKGDLPNKGISTNRVFDAVRKALEGRRADMPRVVAESVDSHWPAFLHEIRRARNDAGHPQIVLPVDRDDVKAALNQVRPILRTASALKEWIAQDMKR
jgi:hypothetical protein